MKFANSFSDIKHPGHNRYLGFCLNRIHDMENVMKQNKVIEPETVEQPSLEELYSQYFTAPNTNTDTSFKQVSLYDDSLKSYTSNATPIRECRAGLE